MTLQQKGLKDKRTCRIFFSSPFGGMENEREELTRRYFPQIHHLCGSRGIQFVAVDMRWGITSEASSSAQVINICLRELDRSDIFVGFFGQRYGWHGSEDKALQENFDNATANYPWLDQYRDKSVTELEFLHGFLNDPGQLPTVICFRDKAYDDIQREAGVKSGDKKQVFKYSAESELSTQLMDDLKKRIIETEEKALEVNMNYKTPAEGAELMFNAIWKYLTEVLLKDTKIESKFSRILSQHNAFISSRSLLYIGNKGHLQVLTKNINFENPEHYIITGPAGSGKSSLLCNWIKHLKADSTFNNVCFIYHFVGAAEESAEVNSMLIQLITQLDRQTDDTEVPENKYSGYKLSSLVNQLVVCMEKLISLGKTPVLVVDGCDKIKKSTKVEKPVHWLPSKLPSGVRLIISTKSSDESNIKELIEERKFTQVEILPLTLEEQRELSEKTLMESGKELSPHQIEKLVAAKETENPLYLKIALNELVVFGYFRLLDKKIDTLTSSANVVELFDKVIQRLEDDYNVKQYTDNLVEQTMCTICLSNSGISEVGLRAIYNIPAHIWSPLYFALRTFIIEQNGLMRFAFTELEEAVSQRYFKNNSKREKYLTDLIRYFEGIKQNTLNRKSFLKGGGSYQYMSTLAHKELPALVDYGDPNIQYRISHELPWLYLKLEDMEGLQKTLLNLIIFSVLKRDCRYDLIELWNKTGVKWNNIADMYSKQIDIYLVDCQQWVEDHLLWKELNASVLLLNSHLLSDLSTLFGVVSPFSAVIFKEREMRITLGCIETYPHYYKEGEKDAVMYGMACQFTEAGKLEEAEKLHLKVIESRQKRYDREKNKDNSLDLGKSNHGLATVYMHQNQHEKAEYHLLKANELESPYVDEMNLRDRYAILMNLGVVCINTGRYEEAIGYCEESLKIQEKLYFGHLPEAVGQLLTNLGLCYRKLMKLDEAEKMYKRSLDIKINALGYNTLDVAKGLMNCGVLEMVRHNFTKGYEYFLEAVKIFQNVGVEESNIDYVMAIENVIHTLINMKKLDEALEKYRPWFQTVSKHNLLYVTLPFTHTEITNHLIETECYQEAIDILLVLLDTEKKDPAYFVNLHKLDMMKGTDKPDRPYKYSLEQGLELFPDAPLISGHLIKDLLIPNNNLDKIVTVLETIQSIFGAEHLYDTVNNWFCQCPNGTDDMSIAINLSALKFVPDQINFLKNVSNGYLRQKKYDEALPHCLKLYELQPDDPENLFWVAKSSFMCDEVEVCKKHCFLAKERFPDVPELIPQIDYMLNGIKQYENETSGHDEVKVIDDNDGCDKGEVIGDKAEENIRSSTDVTN